MGIYQILKFSEVQQEWMELTEHLQCVTACYRFGQNPSLTPEEVMEVYLGSLEHGIESPNHLMVRFDQLDSTIGAKPVKLLTTNVLQGSVGRNPIRFRRSIKEN